MIILRKLSSGKKILLENFISLSTLQGVNYILPLITIPYLVRILGPEKFGLIAFAQAFIQYFIVFTDYGFNLSATRKISIYRMDKVKISQIFNAVMLIKFFLMLINFTILTIVIFAIPKFRIDWQVYLLTFGMVVGNMLFPAWFFQGNERMSKIAFLNILVKLPFTIVIFVFIKTQTDYIYVPVINSLGFLTTGVLSLWIVFKNFDVHLNIPEVAWLIEELKDGWHIFISTVAISLYTASNTFILGLFASNEIVGYYYAGEKLIKVVQGLQVPISQTFYPHISKLANESKEKCLIFIRNIFIIVAVATMLLSLVTFFFAGSIVIFILGAQYSESIVVLKILAFLPFIVGLSNIFGIQTMLTFDMKEIFSKILIFAGLVNIILSLVLIPLYKHIGTSIAVTTTEIFVTLTMYIYLEKKGIKVLKGILVN